MIDEVGSTNARSNEVGLRMRPISLRSVAVYGPLPLTRWHVAHPPLPENSASPRAGSPIFTAAPLASNPDRIYAMSAVTSSVRNIGNDGIPDPGLPVARRRTRSASDTTAGNCPRRRYTLGMWSPFG